MKKTRRQDDDGSADETSSRHKEQGGGAPLGSRTSSRRAGEGQHAEIGPSLRAASRSRQGRSLIGTLFAILVASVAVGVGLMKAWPSLSPLSEYEKDAEVEPESTTPPPPSFVHAMYGPSSCLEVSILRYFACLCSG